MSKITKKQILSLCSIIHNSVEYLNHGGCGVFAFLVGSTLNKFENCSVKVKIVDYYGNFRGNVESAIPQDFTDVYNWNKNGIQFNHIVLEVKLKYCKPFYLDSTGVYEDARILAGSVPVEYIKNITQSPTGWNYTFDRMQIPKIIKNIKAFFNNDRKLCKDLIIKQWQLN